MPDPDATHRVEQASAAVREIAATTRAYYEALIEHGFDEDQAMQLTVMYQMTMLKAAMGGDGDDRTV